MGSACSACERGGKDVTVEDINTTANPRHTSPEIEELSHKDFYSIEDANDAPPGLGKLESNSKSQSKSLSIKDRAAKFDKVKTNSYSDHKGNSSNNKIIITTANNSNIDINKHDNTNSIHNLNAQKTGPVRKLSSVPNCYECGGKFEEISNARNAYDGVGPICDGCHKSNLPEDPSIPTWKMDECYYNCSQCGMIDLCGDCLSDPVIRPKFNNSPLVSPMQSKISPSLSLNDNHQGLLDLSSSKNNLNEISPQEEEEEERSLSVSERMNKLKQDMINNDNKTASKISQDKESLGLNNIQV